MIDLHVHTNFSFDSKELPESYLKKAQLLGNAAIGFVDHYDLDLIREDLPHKVELFDINERFEKLKELQKNTPVEILHGIEFGYSPKAVEEYQKILEDFPFDYSMLSVHTLPELGDFYYEEAYAGIGKIKMYTMYLERVLESVRSNLKFEIVAHIGYLARYVPFENKNLYCVELKPIIDDILNSIIARGLYLEINTSAKPDWGCPEVAILDRYIELGGKLFTVGSDAHSVEAYRKHFDQVKKYLLSRGIDKTYHFKSHKPILDII